MAYEEVTGIDQTENDSENEEIFSYEIDNENKLGILTIRSCRYNDEYKKIVQEFFTEINNGNIENVVVDLRNNGGGSSLVANEFIEYFPVDEYKGWDSYVRFGDYLVKNIDIVNNNKKKTPQFNGSVFILTNVFSYSAAKDFAMLIKDNNLGVLVGEASGNLPDSYGDCLYFTLPNSKFTLSV